MLTVEQITAQHETHPEYVPHCGVCRFAFILRLEEAGNSDTYSKVQIHFQEGESYEQFGCDYLAALHRLQAGGFIETYWNWCHRQYSSGRVDYGGTQHYCVRHTFRNPETGHWAWLSYDSSEVRK
jgi:hypothetical protein